MTTWHLAGPHVTRSGVSLEPDPLVQRLRINVASGNSCLEPLHLPGNGELSETCSRARGLHHHATLLAAIGLDVVLVHEPIGQRQIALDAFRASFRGGGASSLGGTPAGASERQEGRYEPCR